jgi:hypothetical protein
MPGFSNTQKPYDKDAVWAILGCVYLPLLHSRCWLIPNLQGLRQKAQAANISISPGWINN